MQIIALVTENKHGLAVALYATEAAALVAVKRELFDDFDLDETESQTMSAADLGQWIGEEGHHFNFTLQEITAPAFRVTVTDLITGAAVSDHLLTTTDPTEAKEALGSAWNRFGFGTPMREAILWATGSEEPVERITNER